MEIIQHPARPAIKPTTMELQPLPMVIWLDQVTELRIHRHDTLDDVAGAIREHWGLGRKEARQLAAYWFAIGERVHKQLLTGSSDEDWSPSELSADPERRYLR